MASGYRMTEYEFPQAVNDFPQPEGPTPNWKFLEVEERMLTAGDNPEYQSLLKQLRVAGSLAFKAWRLSLWLQILAGLLALFALVALVAGLYLALFTDLNRQQLGTTVGGAVGFLLKTLGTTILTLLLGATVMKFVQYKKTLTRVLIHVGMSLFGFLVARLHVHAFDRLYLRAGRIDIRPDVFLCYVHEDAARAGQLDEWLRGQELNGKRLKTVIDGKDTLYSRRRAKDIRRLIESSRVLVVVSSPDSPPSMVCTHHISHAVSHGVRVVYADISGRAAGAASNGANGNRPAEAAKKHDVVYLGPDEKGRLIPDELERLLRRVKDQRDPESTPHAPGGNGGGPQPATAARERQPEPAAQGQQEAEPKPTEAVSAAAETTEAETAETESAESESLARDAAAPAAGKSEATPALAEDTPSEPAAPNGFEEFAETLNSALDEPAQASLEGDGLKQQAEDPSQPATVTPEGTVENPKG
jgi:hypothetical protein